MRLYLIVPLVAVLAAACASAQAKGSSDKPALNVPQPPPHEVAIPAEPLEPVGEIPGASATPPARPGRPASRENPPKPQASDAKP